MISDVDTARGKNLVAKVALFAFAAVVLLGVVVITTVSAWRAEESAGVTILVVWMVCAAVGAVIAALELL